MKITGYIFEDEGTVKNYISDMMVSNITPSKNQGG